jgi:hypothetical protein
MSNILLMALNVLLVVLPPWKIGKGRPLFNCRVTCRRIGLYITNTRIEKPNSRRGSGPSVPKTLKILSS